MPLMVLGVVLGWLARRTQSLIAPIMLHALFNLVAFFGLYGFVFYDSEWQRANDAGPFSAGRVNHDFRSRVQLPLRK